MYIKDGLTCNKITSIILLSKSIFFTKIHIILYIRLLVQKLKKSDKKNGKHDYIFSKREIYKIQEATPMICETKPA